MKTLFFETHNIYIQDGSSVYRKCGCFAFMALGDLDVVVCVDAKDLKEGVERKYDVSLQKTSCWTDEDISNGICNYLIEAQV